METVAPTIIALAGPNGAGKSTFSNRVFTSWPGVIHFVNADVLARGLSAYYFDQMAMEAGRVMLNHLGKLVAQESDVAFETTLATKTMGPWIAEAKKSGYRFGLFFLWLPNSEMAIERVYRRREAGGHFVPENTVHRRYINGIKNFFRIYRPLADFWKVWNNTEPANPQIIAEGSEANIITVHQQYGWNTMKLTGEYSE